MNHIELYKRVDEILWYHWDPIGVNAHAPRDEYRSYVPIIFDLIINHSSAKTIASKLHEIETITMGLPGNPPHCQEIADKLLDITNNQ